mmetsp:Transcript_17728/g.45024  ORF Transcript_17728/g.45024 Transcript_17728/m.45024 type:complete len:126 (-) Transcript_17728:97-474(-)
MVREVAEAGVRRIPQLTALHPVSLEPPHLSAEQRALAVERLGDAVNRVLATEQAKAEGYGFDEMLRLFLAVRFNAVLRAGYDRPRVLAKLLQVCAKEEEKGASWRRDNAREGLRNRRVPRHSRGH